MEGSSKQAFIEVEYYQVRKSGQYAPGDIFLSQKSSSDGRVITALSDGLGSGIKAGVLATLTATMATHFIASDIPFKRSAEIIMNTLPVCKERGISYATFTLVDIQNSGFVKIMEYDNPSYVLFRNKTISEPVKESSVLERKNKATAPHTEAVLQYSSFEACTGDRIVFFSDGVTQAGMGTATLPFGWGIKNVRNFLAGVIEQNQDVSARELARCVVKEAIVHDSYKAQDDITCGVIYFRHPRDLLIITGPPANAKNDVELARVFTHFEGKKIICGGTTANIMARELNKSVRVELKKLDPKIPPESYLDGADMVTEGIITMGTVSEILEKGVNVDSFQTNAATKMVDYFLNCDRIKFLVGTKINEAHQDPNMPAELEIRRNIIKKIALLLQEKYLKEVHIQYI